MRSRSHTGWWAGCWQRMRCWRLGAAVSERCWRAARSPNPSRHGTVRLVVHLARPRHPQEAAHRARLLHLRWCWQRQSLVPLTRSASLSFWLGAYGGTEWERGRVEHTLQLAPPYFSICAQFACTKERSSIPTTCAGEGGVCMHAAFKSVAPVLEDKRILLTVYSQAQAFCHVRLKSCRCSQRQDLQHVFLYDPAGNGALC